VAKIQTSLAARTFWITYREALMLSLLSDPNRIDLRHLQPVGTVNGGLTAIHRHHQQITLPPPQLVRMVFKDLSRVETGSYTQRRGRR
jgi:hypothetical protein